VLSSAVLVADRRASGLRPGRGDRPAGDGLAAGRARVVRRRASIGPGTAVVFSPGRSGLLTLSMLTLSMLTLSVLTLALTLLPGRGLTRRRRRGDGVAGRRGVRVRHPSILAHAGAG